MIGPIRYVPPPRKVVCPVRDHECSGYDRCLDNAIEHGWHSWTCKGCSRNSVAGDHEIWGDMGREEVIESGSSLWEPVWHGWKPRRPRFPVCLQCGRSGDELFFWHVRGEPRCVLCAPDLGAPVHPEWEHRCISAGVITADHPLLTVAELGRLLGLKRTTAYHYVKRTKLLRYSLGRGLLVVPVEQLGLAVPPGPQGEVVSAGQVRAFLRDEDGRREDIGAVLAGRAAIPWTELAELLARSCTVRLRAGGTP